MRAWGTKKTQFANYNVYFESSERDGLFIAQFFIEFSGLMCLFNFDLFYLFIYSSVPGRVPCERMDLIVFIFIDSG